MGLAEAQLIITEGSVVYVPTEGGIPLIRNLGSGR
jgi:hypothetical protein